MANLIDLITIGEKGILIVDAVPSAASGTPASLGTIAVYDSGTTATMYLKTGAADTAWDILSTSSGSGTVNSGIAGRLALYPSTSNAVDDVYVQNSQTIDVNVVAQPTRSAGIEYTVPNPGDAITAASFVLTEGAQTINGNKTFGNNVVVSGDLTVNGTTTSLATTNTTIKDKLITLNKGGLAASGGGSGFEIEENAIATAYIKMNAAEDGFSFFTPGSAFFADILTSSLATSSKSFVLPNSSGTFVLRPNATPGVAGQVSFFSDTDNVISDSNFNWDNSNKRLGLGTASPSVQLHTTGGVRFATFGTAGILHNDATGVLSSSAISLTADVSGILPLANGGTNANLTAVQGGVVWSGASALGISVAGTAGQALLSGGTAAPTWFSSTGVVHATSGVLSTSAVLLASEVSGTLPVANGGTNSSTALSNNRIMVSSGGAIVESAALTNGQILIGSTGNAPVVANIAQGANNGVVVTNAAGSITLATAQDIRTSASPTFVAATLTGAGASFDLNDTTAGLDQKTTMYTVNTTDATLTTLATIPTVTDKTMLLEVKIIGYRTGGVSGVAGDGATYIRTARVVNVAGTVSMYNLQSDYTSESTVTFNGTLTVSGTDITVDVTGAATTNMTWRAVVTKTI